MMMTRNAMLLSLSVVLSACGTVQADKPASPPDADRGKALIEAPPKALLAEAVRAAAKPKIPPDVTKVKIEARPKALLVEAVRAAPKPRTDISKNDIEAPPKSLLVESTADAAKTQMKKVAAGEVHWHADFKTALAKSGKSNKPVLLFQLLGQLDEEFT